MNNHQMYDTEEVSGFKYLEGSNRPTERVSCSLALGEVGNWGEKTVVQVNSSS